jgi:hypothetical protein
MIVNGDHIYRELRFFSPASKEGASITTRSHQFHEVDGTSEKKETLEEEDFPHLELCKEEDRISESFLMDSLRNHQSYRDRVRHPQGSCIKQSYLNIAGLSEEHMKKDIEELKSVYEQLQEENKAAKKLNRLLIHKLRSLNELVE